MLPRCIGAFCCNYNVRLLSSSRSLSRVIVKFTVLLFIYSLLDCSMYCEIDFMGWTAVFLIKLCNLWMLCVQVLHFICRKCSDKINIWLAQQYLFFRMLFLRYYDLFSHLLSWLLRATEYFSSKKKEFVLICAFSKWHALHLRKTNQ